MENHIAASVIFIVLYLRNFIRADVNLMCDLYRANDDYKNNTIYTVVSYSLPRKRFNKIRANVPCPCFENRLCIRKCCLPEYTFNLTSRKCVRAEPQFTEENDDLPGQLYTEKPSTFVYGSTCQSVGTPLDGYKLLEKNGHLESDYEELSLLEYCYDYFNDQSKYMILRCEIQAAPKLYTICQIVSICLLSLTFAIYFFIDELRNLPGKILLCYVLSIIATDIGHTVLQVFLIIKGTVCIILGTYRDRKIIFSLVFDVEKVFEPLCIAVLAYSIQFSFLSSFFWLNSMCIDLWLTFRYHKIDFFLPTSIQNVTIRRIISRKHSSLERSPQISGHLRKFSIYSVYAWGCPLVVSSLTAIADSSLIPGSYVKPEFGVGSCWFHCTYKIANVAPRGYEANIVSMIILHFTAHEAKFWYFYSFVSVILIINLYMFVVTTVRIIRRRKQSEIFRKNGNKRHIEHERQK